MERTLLKSRPASGARGGMLKDSESSIPDTSSPFPGHICVAGDMQMKHRVYGKELCLLSLDGGGVRGLSTLLILKRLMECIDPVNPPKPCEYFDMIGGTSTGGLIALMLGRLRMPVDEAIDAYLMLAPRIFSKVHHRVNLKGQLQGRFDHTAIKNGVQDLLDEKGYKRDDLLKDELGDECKTFVCATNKITSETVVLSSYPSRRRGSDLLNITKIWEAARATAAASSFFDPISIGGVEFVDGATPANNPISEIWTEAFDTFKEGDDWRLEDNILCLVSIGTGTPSLKSFGNDPINLGRALLAIATDTERKAEDFHRHHSRMALENRYIRLNVLRGLEDVGLEDVSKKDQITACTQKYLQSEAVFNAVEICASMLIGRENLQPIIEAVQRNSALAKAEFSNLRELRDVQDAIAPASNSLAWFVNTLGYRRWLQREEESEYIWYPITNDTISHKHQNVIAALCYYLLQQCAPEVHAAVDIFYVRFSNIQATQKAELTTITSTSIRHEDIFANLISQVLITVDVRKAILGFSRQYRNLLRQLFNKSKSIGQEDLTDLLLACLRQKDILDEINAKPRRPKIIALEHVEDIAQITACKLAFKAARLSGNTRLLVSTKSGDAGTFESWYGCKIDESTECTECLESLQFETMFARREQVACPELGTNEWISSYGPYVEWASERSGILWIQGKPGSGKSVLAKTILSHLTKRPATQTWIVADWFYNARGGECSTSHTSMLRAILFQILKQDQRLFSYYQNAYRSPRWLDSLAEVLLRIAEGGIDVPIICIIDAMDESKDEFTSKSAYHHNPETLEAILELLQNVVNISQSSMKLLILSRPNRLIEKSLKRYHKVLLQNANTRDVELVVDAALRSLSKAIAAFDSSDEEGLPERKCRRQPPKPNSSLLSPLTTSSSTNRASSNRIFKKSREYEEEGILSIRNYLLSNARGVILWVTLITKDLLRHVQKGMFTFQELQKLLGELPLEIHGLYCRITHDLLLANSELDQIKARRILLWVIGASRTRLLELRELLDALAIVWDVDSALQSIEDPVSSSRPQVRSWNHFRRSLHELCGPFIEVIGSAPCLSGELLDDFEVGPTFLVQLTHQTAKDFLTCSDAQAFQVTLSEAEDTVRHDKLKYLKVALPKIPTSYMPKIEATHYNMMMKVEELALYFEQKLLLQYVLETLPPEICREHVFQLGKTSPSMWAFMARHCLDDRDIIKSTEDSIVGTYFLVAIKAGLVHAIKNMLAVTSATEWWWRFYHNTVENAALLAAIEYGLLTEVQTLIRRHPNGELFLSANNLLLRRAGQTGIEAVAMCIYDKAFCGQVSHDNTAERNSFLESVRKAPGVSGVTNGGIEEVLDGIQTIINR